jgi:hypothetical protein
MFVGTVYKHNLCLYVHIGHRSYDLLHCAHNCCLWDCACVLSVMESTPWSVVCELCDLCARTSLEDKTKLAAHTCDASFDVCGCGAVCSGTVRVAP